LAGWSQQRRQRVPRPFRSKQCSCSKVTQFRQQDCTVVHGTAGSQTHLRDLELSFNATYRCWTSPFLQLDVGPANGLDQLSELLHLEYFSVTGLLHEVGAAEIGWVREHWPRLKKIQLPIFGRRDKCELAQYLSCCDTFAPDYTPWFPKLTVIKISGYHYACFCGSKEDECCC
jgi:hypothetical protein